MFNRYDGAAGMHFGTHVDGAVRLLPGTGMKIRTDISATLFISPPEEYDGGELQVEDTYGAHSVKLPAGDLVLYPASSLHRVTPVTRGCAHRFVFLDPEPGARRRAAGAAVRSRHGGRAPDTGRAGARIAGFTNRLLSQPAAHVGGALIGHIQ